MRQHENQDLPREAKRAKRIILLLCVVFVAIPLVGVVYRIFSG